ncbi:MAG: hypothetical protein Fur0042_28660 [Cyanophyceae cyanobacterium]
MNFQGNDGGSLLERLNGLDDRYNRIILMGQGEWIEQVIKTLHLCGVGERILWSPAVPTGRGDQKVRILARSRL